MLQTIENKLQTISRLKYWSLLLIFAGIRVGVSPIGKEWFGWLLEASKSFPQASSYVSYSLIPVVLLKLLGLSSPYAWWTFWLILDISWLVFCFLRIEKKFGNSARFLQLILVMSQSVMLNFTMVGHYDNLIFIAGTSLLLFDGKIIYILSAFLVGGANPNIGFATGVCLFLYFVYSKNVKHFQIALSWFLVSLGYLITTHIWFTAPKSGTRESIVMGQFGEVIKGSLGVWWFIPLTILGPLAPLFGYLVIEEFSNAAKRFTLKLAGLISSIFIIPTGMAFLILDHTRIGVSTGGIVLFLYIFENHERILNLAAKNKFPVLSVLFVIWILTPPVIVDSGGVFRLPHLKYLQVN